MINRITVNPSTKESDILFFNEIDLTTLPDKRIVLLFGPNGVGKSTLLEALATSMTFKRDFFNNSSQLNGGLTGVHPCTIGSGDLNTNGIDLIDMRRVQQEKGITIERDTHRRIKKSEYFNSTDNYKTGFARVEGDSYSFDYRRCNVNSISEGQSIVFSIMDMIDSLNSEPYIEENNIHQVVLLDEIDSGLSIDNIDIIMLKIKSILQKRKENIQFFISFNNPRVLKHFPYVISMYDGKCIEMHSDEDMLKEIRDHDCIFGQRRKDERGLPRVYKRF